MNTLQMSTNTEGIDIALEWLEITPQDLTNQAIAVALGRDTRQEKLDALAQLGISIGQAGVSTLGVWVDEMIRRNPGATKEQIGQAAIDLGASKWIWWIA